jgi:hypothetical protein
MKPKENDQHGVCSMSISFVAVHLDSKDHPTKIKNRTTLVL